MYVCVCMYVCACMYIYVCVRMYVCGCTYVCTYVKTKQGGMSRRYKEALFIDTGLQSSDLKLRNSNLGQETDVCRTQLVFCCDVKLVAAYIFLKFCMFF